MLFPSLPLRYSPMVILVDTNSFLREDPRILENFGQLVQVFDIGAEMEKKMSTDLFGPVYE